MLRRANGLWLFIFHNVPCEEAINCAKNQKLGLIACKFQRPKRATAVVIETDMRKKRHAFDPTDANILLVRKSVKLDKAAFGKSIKDREPTVDLKRIVSTQQKTTWFSLAFANIGLPATGLPVFRESDSAKVFNANRTVLSIFYQLSIRS